MISKDEKASELPGKFIFIEYFNIIDKYFHKVFKILAQTILYVMDCMSLVFKPHNPWYIHSISPNPQVP